MAEYIQKDPNIAGYGHGIKRTEAIKRWKASQAELATKVRQTVDVPGLVEKIKDISPERAEKLNEQAIEALGRLVASIGDKVTEFDTLISDESGGRIPTNIIARIASLRRSELGIKEPVRVNYLTAGRVGDAGFHPREWKDRLDAFLTKNQSASPPAGAEAQERQVRPFRRPLGKTLIITEGTRSGETITDLVNKFQEHEVDVSVAIVAAENIPELLRQIGGKVDVFVAEQSSLGEDIFYHATTGVTKKNRKGKHPFPHPLRDPKADQEKVAQERQIASLIAKEMLPLVR